MLQPGQLLGGKYRVERLLGEGGMGVVVVARHQGLNEQVALKVLRSDLPRSRDHLERLRREAQVMARLRSEHIARVTDVGTLEGGEPYLVMEYVRGGSLRQLLEQKKCLPEGEAASLLLQVCEGLAEAHAAGIVHRDLKPSNLMVSERPDGSPLVKIVDFGIAKNSAASLDTLTTSRSLLGSPLYMAPEQMRDAHDADARSDIWALGVTLYEMLTARVPFPAFTNAAIIASVLTDEPLPPRHHVPRLSAELEEVVLRCLAKPPGERFADVGQLARALAPFAPDGASCADRVGRILARTPALSPPPEPLPAHSESSPPMASRTVTQRAPTPASAPAEAARAGRGLWALAVAGLALPAIYLLRAGGTGQRPQEPAAPPALAASLPPAPSAPDPDATTSAHAPPPPGSPASVLSNRPPPRSSAPPAASVPRVQRPADRAVASAAPTPATTLRFGPRQ